MQKTIQNIKIEEVSISSLKASSYNPRKITEKQEKDLTESIKRFGLVDPIIVNSYSGRENIIIGGHARFNQAKKLNYKKVPVVYLSLPLNKERELNLRLNRNTGEWNYEILKSFDVDLLLETGFDELDFSKIFDETLEVEDDNFNIEKEIKKAKTTKIKTGDMFEIAGQRVICGDCNNIETIKKLMGEDKADMIYTDPPYNIGINYSKGLGGKQNYGGVVNDNKSDGEYKEFVKKSLSNGLSVSKDNVHVFYYHDPKYTGMFQEIYKELKIQYKRTVLWVKNGMNITP
ncbi:MAG: ParB N-terminal domain-containing protein, partial [Patescibacteria group bacterium]